jgi:16S rRNA (cytosine1402-N4)-methyltransferase
LLDANKTIKVYGLDWDENALNQAESFPDEYQGRLMTVWGSFAHLYKIIKKYKLPKFDGILADFGTSQNQIFERNGFSVHRDTPLDMRMSVAHFKTTAADIINEGSEEELRQLFWTLGEERNARKIVFAIVEARKKKKISTTGELASLIEKTVGRAGKIHPATRVFQALRISVNQELENITAFLPVALDALKPGGRLVCISFHSLEDRIVKHYFQEQVKIGTGVVPFKRALIAGDEELAQNSASRSAKLRAFEKK